MNPCSPCSRALHVWDNWLEMYRAIPEPACWQGVSRAQDPDAFALLSEGAKPATWAECVPAPRCVP